MNHLNLNQMQSLQGGLCLNDGITPGLEKHFGDCFEVCNLLNVMNPTYGSACTA